MKRIITLICLLTAFVAAVQAQEKPDTEKMLKERMDNMRQNLSLSSSESKSFYTAYEQFLRSEIKYHETFRTNMEKNGIKQCVCMNKESYANLTDKQMTYMQDQKFELRKNMLNLESTFYKKLKAILTPRHIQDFYRIDEQYRRDLVNKVKCQKNNTQTEKETYINSGKKKR